MVSQIKVNEIIKQSGSSITIGESGDTVTIPSGATLNSAGTNTLTGIDNAPAWMVNLSSSQNVASATETVINFDTEVLDSASAYDTSNGRFTVPSGEGGKYYVNVQLSHNSNAVTDTSYVAIKIYKNGSDNEAYPSAMFYNDTTGFWRSDSFNASGIMNLAAGDYIEAYGRIDDLGSGSGPAFGTRIFQAYKLIGV